ncbi:MAG: thermonuclease family protein [Pseudomonadota bacterium]
MAFLCLGLAAPHLARAETWTAIDGDTLRSNSGEYLRMRGLDAPESFRPHCRSEAIAAAAATRALKALIAGKTIVILRHGRDKYGRTLGDVFVDGVNVAGVMVKAGVAKPWLGRNSNWCLTSPR